MAKYLDYDGLVHFWEKIKALSSGVLNTVNGYTINGKKINTDPTLYAGDIFLTQDEENTVFEAINERVPKSGGTMTGALTFVTANDSTKTIIQSYGVLVSDGSSVTNYTSGVIYVNADTNAQAVILPASAGTLALTSDITDATTALKNGLATINGQSITNGGNITIDLTLFKVVDELPTSGIDATKIYLVKSATSETNNVYTEYMYVNNAWEKLGEYKTDVDLSDYVKSITTSGSGTFINGVTKSGNTLTFTKGSISNASSSAAGLMSAADKKTLDDVKTTYLPLAGGTLTGGLSIKKTLAVGGTVSSDSIIIGTELVASKDASNWVDITPTGINTKSTEKGLFSYTYPSADGTLALTSDITSAISSNVVVLTTSEIDAICV